MLVVLSDLHFVENESVRIQGLSGMPERNVNERPYHTFLKRLAAEAKRSGAKRIDLVLAGDIFEMLRTLTFPLEVQKRH